MQSGLSLSISRADRLIQSQEGVYQHPGGQGQIGADPCACLPGQTHRGIQALASHKFPAGGADFLPEPFIRIVDYPVPPGGQFPHHPQGGMDMALGGNGEKYNGRHYFPSSSLKICPISR